MQQQQQDGKGRRIGRENAVTMNSYNSLFSYMNRIWLPIKTCTVMQRIGFTTTLLRFLWIMTIIPHVVIAQDYTSSSSLYSWSTTCQPYAMPLQLVGKKFFKSTDGSYMPLKGIDYYPRPNAGTYTATNSVDFFTEDFAHIWQRDIANFKNLNINAVRIYAVNPGLNHDAFMCALKEAGIYVIVGLAADCLDCAITPESAPGCYPEHLKERGEFIINAFARYDNVIGFDAGNEISISTGSETINGPCQKQFIRDMRQFIQTCTKQGTMRHIPIGLAAADGQRDVKALYYNCRGNASDELENAEYLGMNVYLHCTGGLTSIDQMVGFTTLLSDFTSFSLNIPVILTEFGCINPSFPTLEDYNAQRDFLQIDAIFDPSYETEFAGGFVFEYNTELVNSVSPFPFTDYGAGNFGVGYLSPVDCDDANITCSYIPFPQFDALATKYADVNMNSGVTIDNYVPPDRPYPACPSGFPLLSSFQWPTIANIQCPEDLTVICPNLPPVCNTPTHPRSQAIPTPVAPSSPTPVIYNNTESPSKSPTNHTSKSPTISTLPTTKPTKTPVETKPVVRPSSASTSSSTRKPTAESRVTHDHPSDRRSIEPTSNPSVIRSIRPSPTLKVIGLQKQDSSPSSEAAAAHTTPITIIMFCIATMSIMIMTTKLL